MRCGRNSITQALILTIGLSFLSGCGNPKDFGYAPWQEYDTPPEIAFTEEEQEVLEGFARGHPDLAKKIINQKNAWRAIVLEHNKQAKEMFRKQMKSLGYTDEQLARLTGQKR